MSDVVRWEEPPPVPKPRGRWSPVVEALKENPGVWALIVERESKSYVRHVSWYLRAHYRVEATWRSLNGAEASVWARWPA